MTLDTVLLPLARVPALQDATIICTDTEDQGMQFQKRKQQIKAYAQHAIAIQNEFATDSSQFDHYYRWHS